MKKTEKGGEGIELKGEWTLGQKHLILIQSGKGEEVEGFFM